MEKVYTIGVTELHARILLDTLSINAEETEDLVLALTDIIKEAKAEAAVAEAARIAEGPRRGRRAKRRPLHRHVVVEPVNTDDGEAE